jgi:hypothetical protein
VKLASAQTKSVQVQTGSTGCISKVKSARVIAPKLPNVHHETILTRNAISLQVHDIALATPIDRTHEADTLECLKLSTTAEKTPRSAMTAQLLNRSISPSPPTQQYQTCLNARKSRRQSPQTPNCPSLFRARSNPTAFPQDGSAGAPASGRPGRRRRTQMGRRTAPQVHPSRCPTNDARGWQASALHRPPFCSDGRVLLSHDRPDTPADGLWRPDERRAATSGREDRGRDSMWT